VLVAAPELQSLCEKFQQQKTERVLQLTLKCRGGIVMHDRMTIREQLKWNNSELSPTSPLLLLADGGGMLRAINCMK
jgi:hypothetical protein